MTRENKLALVVGFGLILLVGILISDHISTAYSQEPAELARAVDPLSVSRPAPADLIAVRTAKPATGESRIAAADVRAADSSRTGALPAIEMGGPPPAVVGLNPADAQTLPFRFHTVTAGDSLSRICTREYGDASLALELAAYNELERPDHIEEGTRLRLPKADDLVRGRPAPTGLAPRAATPPKEDRTYTVQEGDALSRIAARVLGSSARFQEIFDLNRDKLKDPDDIRPGMVLRVP